jgi:diguanylate cyclase (GGDEF)-like protein/PAS domain S-box-containing protein
LTINSSLALRLALFITITSFGIAYIASEAFYRQTFAAEIEQSENEIKTLFETVSPTASIAAFIEDAELAKEVLNGLSTSKKIKAVAFTSDKIKEFQNVHLVKNETPRIFIIKNPFIQGDKLAELHVYPNLAFIEEQAAIISRRVTFALYILIFVVTVTSIVIGYYLITRPLKKVGRSLHEVMPGSEQQINTPKYHSKTEIGTLVNDTNILLNRMYHQFREERRLRNEIEKLEQQFRLLFENATSPIVLIDFHGNVQLKNKAFRVLTEQVGISNKNRLGYLLGNLVELPKTMDMAVHEAIKHNEILTSEVKVKNFKDNTERWVQFILSPFASESEEVYFHITLNDISRRKKEISSLAKEADYDSLTKVLNRNGGEKLLREMIQQQKPFAVVLIDLNGFKPINDTFGHDAGDVVLVKTAELISGVIREQDQVIRWGGDEFIIILNVNNRGAIERAMKKIVKKVVRDYQFSNNQKKAHIAISAGAAVFPHNAVDLHGLIRLADEAMYESKRLKDIAPEKYLHFAQELT